MRRRGRPRGPRFAGRRRRSRLPAALLVLVLAAGGIAYALTREENRSDDIGANREGRATVDSRARACDVPKKLIRRIRLGYDPAHSEDVTFIPAAPNYSGNFAGPSHSGPWDYLQEVPFVLYGQGFVEPQDAPIQEPATITDFYPTVGEVLDVELPERDGSALTDVLVDTAETPRLVVVVVWDGVGRNVLDRWPQAWPTLAALEEDGASFRKATVGSSPSITPATHSSLGTGTFPMTHGVTGIQYRAPGNEVGEAFKELDPFLLEPQTFADTIDAALGNASKVGILASHSWHLGMMGHGSQIEGGDKDQIVLVGRNGLKSPAPEFYAPPSVPPQPGEMSEYVEATDLIDGRLDDKWLGHEITDPSETPALVDFQTEATLQMLKQEGYGTDGVPDLFFVNFKTGDTMGHQYTMDSPEMKGVIEAQDEGLGEIVDLLDEQVGDYLLLVTADHGHTPSPESSGGWPIGNTELVRDLDAHFGVEGDRSLVQESVAVGLFLDRRLMQEIDVTTKEISDWLGGYTLRENWAEAELPEGYEDRGDELLFQAVFPTDDVPEILRCADSD